MRNPRLALHEGKYISTSAGCSPCDHHSVKVLYNLTRPPLQARITDTPCLCSRGYGYATHPCPLQARITDTHNKGSRTANKDKGSGTGNKGEGTEVALLKLDHGKHSLLTPLWCNWAGLYMQLYETPHWLTGSVSDKDLKYQFASSLLVNSIEPPPPPHCGIKGAVKQSHFQDLKSDT